jgi:hypothetical protein
MQFSGSEWQQHGLDPEPGQIGYPMLTVRRNRTASLRSQRSPSTISSPMLEIVRSRGGDGGSRSMTKQTAETRRLAASTSSTTGGATTCTSGLPGPHANVNVNVKLKTDKKGFDVFDLTARHIARNRDYTVFLLETAAAPFGAAEYIGDLSTGEGGNGHAQFSLIVQEAFSSTVVDGKRVRVDLNRVGMWFADPKDDEFCVPGSGPTPFDGDGEAGVQAFNSATRSRFPLRKSPQSRPHTTASAAQRVGRRSCGFLVQTGGGVCSRLSGS